MSHADFVHLRVHSAYSLSEGALKIPELIRLCTAQRMPAVAVTDTGNLFGAMEFAPAAAKAGVQPIIGAQLGIRREDAGPLGGGALAPDPLVLLVQDETGYRNLLALLSKSFLETEGGEQPQVALADLEAAHQGLIALTGGPAGAVGRLLGEGQGPAARAMTERLAAIFDDRLYVELMRHGMAEEARTEPGLLDLAYALGLPLVATNEAFFADREMFEAHDALLCIAGGAYVAQADRRRLTPEHCFKPAAEMRELFADLPEAVDNTLVVAQRCAYMPRTRDPILPVYTKLGGRTEIEALSELAREGLERRLAAPAIGDSRRHPMGGAEPAPGADSLQPYRERLEYELSVIEQMGFPGYFLIVADFIQWAKGEGIPVGPGRGSGAGSVVAWALTITDLDPLCWGLLFERFLNPERVSMPDFDIDFCMERRDAVLDYVQSEYGADRVAQIITFGKLQARAVLRDVGRVLEMPYSQVDRLCKMVPNNPANPVTLQQAIDGEPALQQMRDEDETVARLIGIALRLEGLYRHASTHAAGVVIGDRPLEELVPLYRDPRSHMPVTQFNMKHVESAGLVKYDFLGLRTLTVLARALELLATRGVDLDLSALPLDDARTYAMLCRGDATGVFQMESSGMRDVLRKLRPDRFEDLIAVVALYRPGPMDNIPSYIKRKHGEETPDYLHPSLEPILKETYGIMIYQEQVMQIAQVLSGYSLGGADLLRRAMGKKIQAEMDAQRAGFVDGAVARGVDRGQAARIFDQVNKFAGYGFNKSHAAAYALVAWQTAYLKANYPVEFMAALMSTEMGNTDKLGTLRAELDRIGVALLPPDVNRSGAGFTVEMMARAEQPPQGGVGEPRKEAANGAGQGAAARPHPSRRGSAAPQDEAGGGGGEPQVEGANGPGPQDKGSDPSMPHAEEAAAAAVSKYEVAPHGGAAKDEPSPLAGEGRVRGNAARAEQPPQGGVCEPREDAANGPPGEPVAAIRYALAALRNVGGAAMAALVAEREARGPFADLMDFAERLDPHQVNKRQLEQLAAAGAFESLGVNRRQAAESVDIMMRHAAAAQSERESAQESLFGGAEAAAELRPSVPTLPEWPAEERLRREFEALGFYLSAHPLESYRKLCDRLGVVQWREVAAGAVRGERAKLAGIVTSRRLTTSSRGARMAFVQMSDASGAFEVTLFSEVLATARDLLDAGQPLLLHVDIQRREEDVRLTASRIELLDAAATHAAAGLRIFVNDAGPLETLAAVFREHGAKGRGRVSLVLNADAREVELELGQGYAISPAMRGAIKSIPGIVDVQDL
jgi:DNA polymerase-3 subunit alpha